MDVLLVRRVHFKLWSNPHFRGLDLVGASVPVRRTAQIRDSANFPGDGLRSDAPDSKYFGHAERP